MSYDELVAFTLRFPETEEATFYGRPSVRRGKRQFLSLKEYGDTVALKLDWNDHDRFLEAHPDVLFKTEHYEGWPWLLVRLPLLEARLAEDLVDAAWKGAPCIAKRRGSAIRG